jgi:serine/threonine-protein kinase HipA
MILRIGVFLTDPAGRMIPAGEIGAEDGDGEFRYTPSYLALPEAFPLDPVQFPLLPDPAGYRARDGVAPVFEDSLPDTWGRRLLLRRANLPRHEQTLGKLLLELGAGGLGALSYAPASAPPPPPPAFGLTTLPDLLDAAEKIEAGEIPEDRWLRALLAAGSSPGGARPKVLVDDEGIPSIAKFPAKGDLCAIVPLEAATMSLARRAGVETAQTRIMDVGRRKVLIVRRFDVTPVGGRRHMVSFRTLLRGDDYSRFGYDDLFEVVRSASGQPEIDRVRLFRQMVFNAYIGNTDDHTKNFTMLHDDRGFFLSPAYDLLPAVGGDIEHALAFRLTHVFPGRKELEAIGKKHGIRGGGIIDEVADSMTHFLEECESCGVPSLQAERFRKEIDARVRKGDRIP